MSSDIHNFPVLILYVLCCEIIAINSRTSTMWRLNADKTKIVGVDPFEPVESFEGDPAATRVPFPPDDDPIFDIITSTVHLGQSWIKQDSEYYCTNCPSGRNRRRSNTSQDQYDSEDTLDCGKPVNYTYFDNLVGIVNRHRHPSNPEPEAPFLFTIGGRRGRRGPSEAEIDNLERKLRKAKRERPKSVTLYTQIGNYLRMKGEAGQAIECFRRALAVAPHNPDALLSLARLLFSLQYLDDAIFLTRRSLEHQPAESKGGPGAWQQHFTLGEIFKAYGHYQEAGMHLRHVLEMRPGFEPARIALKEMERVVESGGTVHVYTLVIIICLVLGVLLVILSSVDNTPETECLEVRSQRHFNKAMAMRSLRGFTLSQKPIVARAKKPIP